MTGADTVLAPSPCAADRAPRASLGANIRWGLAGNAVYSAAQWVQFGIAARLGGPAAVGAYAYVLALAAPAFALASLQLRALQVGDVRGASAFREYRRLRLVTTGGAVAIIVATAIASGDWRDMWPLLVPVCAMRTADALADIYYGAWQQTERMATANAGLMLNGIASAALMALAARLGGGLPGAVVGSALGSSLALAYIHLSTARDDRLRVALAPSAPCPSWGRVLRLAVQACPLGVIVLLTSVHQNAPRYFIRHYGGDAALGLFAAASQLTAAGTLVVSSIGAAVSPRLARLLHAGDLTRFATLTRRATLGCGAVGAAGVLLAAIIGPAVLAVVYRPEFAEGGGVLVVLSVAATLGFAAALLGYALTVARVLARQTFVLGGALAMLAAACAVLVPRAGAIGAAWAVVAASAVQLLANALAVRRVGVAPRPPAAARTGSRAGEAAP